MEPVCAKGKASRFTSSMGVVCKARRRILGSWIELVMSDISLRITWSFKARTKLEMQSLARRWPSGWECHEGSAAKLPRVLKSGSYCGEQGAWQCWRVALLEVRAGSLQTPGAP